MDLRQEISLDSIKKIFKRDKNNKEVKLKTTINFVATEEDETNWSLAIPGIILIVIGSFLFARFAVVGRFENLARAQGEVEAIQAQIDAGMAEINGAGELTDRFYHYTWTGMTEEELSRESRVSIAELISYINSQGLNVLSYTLTEDRLSVSVVGSSLEQISQVVAKVRERDIVESASVSTAQTNSDAESGGVGVTAQINIFIGSLTTEDTAEVSVVDGETQEDE